LTLNAVSMNRFQESRFGQALAEASTYTSAKGGFTNCPLRVEKTWLDSINVIYIETFSMIRKQMEIYQNTNFFVLPPGLQPIDIKKSRAL
jgi:hypothetical protein